MPALFRLAAYATLTAAGGLGLWLTGAGWVLLLGLPALPVLLWQLVLGAFELDPGFRLLGILHKRHIGFL
ncbi:MAG: hypothetical protein NZM11_06125 [Anaerolineales bacterium]|nr:hypothetical protein [Anaerolineales bacterium]